MNREITEFDLARGERLREAIQEFVDAEMASKGKRPSDAEIGRRVGIGPTAVLSHKKGGQISPRAKRGYAQVLNITEQWLLYGAEPKRPKEAPVIAEVKAKEQRSRSTGLEEWLERSPQGKRANVQERAWLRACPWPKWRCPDEAYLYALLAARESQKKSDV